MKKESSNYQERYFKWKDSVKDGIPNVNKENSDLILKLLNDFERGLNISNASKKGARSFARLTNIKDRLIYFDKNFKQYFNVEKFKTFWHWYMKVNRKEGREIIDITTDLDSRRDKPKWVYFTEEEIKKFI